MKKLLLITALLIASNGLAQKYLSQYDIDEERFGNERIFTLSANDEPLEGAYKVAIGGGDYYEATFKKGRIDGAKKTYNDKGELIVEEHYKNGLPEGAFTQYREGKVIRLTTYKDGKLDGKSARYTDKGQPDYETFYKDGKKEGEWKYYDDEGKVERIETYKNDEKNGKWWRKMVSNHGNYTTTKYYTNGKPSGKWVEQWENGLLREERDYKDEKTYTQRNYHLNGNPKSEVSYKDDKLHGARKNFNGAGVLQDEQVFDADKLITRKIYHSNGRLKEETNYKNDEKNGKYSLYN